MDMCEYMPSWHFRTTLKFPPYFPSLFTTKQQHSLTYPETPPNPRLNLLQQIKSCTIKVIRLIVANIHLHVPTKGPGI